MFAYLRGACPETGVAESVCFSHREYFVAASAAPWQGAAFDKFIGFESFGGYAQTAHHNASARRETKC